MLENLHGLQEGTPLQAAAEAGPRAVDVYMGVDVFGRGTYGGGGLTCDVAINAAFDAGAQPYLQHFEECKILMRRGNLLMLTELKFPYIWKYIWS